MTITVSTILAVFAVALVVVVGNSCSEHRSGDTEPTPVLSGAPSTAFPMPPLKANSEIGWVTAEGARIRLNDYAGKVLVLDFYATWCLPCRQSIPHLAAMQDRFGTKGLQIVGLNVGGADDRIKVPDFAREMRIQYPLGFPDKALTDFFLSDNQTLPQTFIFGRDGRLLKRAIGYDGAIGSELEKTIQTALEQ